MLTRLEVPQVVASGLSTEERDEHIQWLYNVSAQLNDSKKRNSKTN